MEAAGYAGDIDEIDLFERLEHAINRNNIQEAWTLLEENPYLRDNLNTPPSNSIDFGNGTTLEDKKPLPLYVAIRALWDNVGKDRRLKRIIGWNDTANPFQMIRLLSHYGASFLAPHTTLRAMPGTLTPLQELVSIRNSIRADSSGRGIDEKNYRVLQFIITNLEQLRDDQIRKKITEGVVRDAFQSGLARNSFAPFGPGPSRRAELLGNASPRAIPPVNAAEQRAELLGNAPPRAIPPNLPDNPMSLPDEGKENIKGFLSFGKKIYTGSRGGKYYKKGGKNIYLTRKKRTRRRKVHFGSRGGKLCH